MLSVSKAEAESIAPLYQSVHSVEVVFTTLSNGKTFVGLFKVTFTLVINDDVNLVSLIKPDGIFTLNN